MMETVNFIHMSDMTAQDTKIIADAYDTYSREGLVDQLISMLLAMRGPTFGYKIDRFRHSLQSATRALRNGEEAEMVVAALFHDIGDPISPENHGAVASEILRPYVADRTYWILRHHGLFQGYYYFHHLGANRDARDIYRDHQWFDDCVSFCQNYDQNCFDPDFDELRLEEFMPLVQEVLGQGPIPSTSDHD